MPVAALLLSAGLCLAGGLLPAKLCRRRSAGRDFAAAGAVFAGVWACAFLFFSKPGLFAGFGLFRLCAVCGASAAGAACVCTLRCTGLLRAARRRLLAAAALVLCALTFEVFFGNVKYFATHEYTPIQLFDYLDGELSRNADGSVALSGESTVLHFTGIDQPLYNLQLEGLSFHYPEAPAREAAQNPLFTIRIDAADEANALEFTGGSWDVAVRAPRSWNRALDFSGDVSSMTLTAAPYDGEYIWYSFDYTLTGITANAPQPFAFSWLRFAVALAACAAVWSFRPGSSLWQMRYLEDPRRFRPGVLVCAGALCLIACLTPFADPINSGVATAWYNANNWDGGSRVSFTRHINDWQHDTTSQLGSLASSLLDGRLDLEIDPPQALLEMDNPYDTAARQAQAPDALWDVAFYNGRYYVYFGVVPCLLFQLPFEAITGISDLPNCAGMMVMAVAAVIAAFGLVRQAARRWFPGVSAAAYLLASTAVAGCGQMFYLLFRANVYEYVILCGAAFVMLALWQWLAAANTPDDRRGVRIAHLMLGSACMALVAGCRPQMELFAFLALPIFWRQYVTEKRLFSRKGMVELVLFALPFVLVAAGLMWYNAARFGSPFDFGANYNLTSNDMTKRGFNPGRIGPALFYYLLALPGLKATFPYVSELHLYTNYIGRTVTELFYGGAVGCTPFLWMFALLPFLRRRLAKKRLWGIVGWPLACAVMLSALDAVMAGILYRYQMDFALPLLFAGALCWLAAEEALSGHTPALRPLQYTLRSCMGLAVGAGLVYGFCVVCAAEPWLYGQNPALYQNISRLVQFWL